MSDVVIVVDGLRGIVSFQVRSVDPNGDLPPPNSNIEHQMIGMEGFHSIGPPWFEQADRPCRGLRAETSHRGPRPEPDRPWRYRFPLLLPPTSLCPRWRWGSGQVRPAIDSRVVQVPVVRGLHPGVPVERGSGRLLEPAVSGSRRAILAAS